MRNRTFNDVLKGYSIIFFKKNIFLICENVSFFLFEGIPLPYCYPYPSFVSFRGSHLLPGQDLDAMSIPFQIYFIQAATIRFFEPAKLQFQFLVQKPRGV